MDYIHAIRVIPGDEGALYALRGVAHFAQKTGNKNSVVKGVSADAWRADGFVTFRFSDARYVETFRAEATRLLAGHWTERT